jgi:hypothetical protein
MRPVHIGLLVAAAAFGGALVMKLMQDSPVPQPAPLSAQYQQPAPEALPMAEPVVPAEPARPPAFEPRPAVSQPEPRRQAAARPQPAPAVSRPAPAVQQPAPAPQATVPAPAPAPEPAYTPTPEPPPVVSAEPSPPPPPPPPQKVTLAAGTLVPVRLVEGLSSERNQPGDSFTATLDQPLVVDGFVIAERGARLEGKVVEMKESGRVRGVASLGISLTRLRTSDGQTIAIATDTFTKEAPATVGEDVKRGAAATGIGAAIGAIAGGGKGAAIGAAVGAAAGTGAAVATKGKPAVLATETRLNFRLSEAVTITERRR